MKFSMEICRLVVAPWLSEYVDYDGLKRCISTAAPDWDTVVASEVELVTNFACGRRALIDAQISHLSDRWRIPWSDGQDDDTIFPAMSLCELQHLFLILKDCIDDLLAFGSYINVNTTALRKLGSKSSIVNEIGAKQLDGSVNKLDAMLTDSLAQLDNLRRYRDLVKEAIKTASQVGSRSLLLKNVFNHSNATEVVRILTQDDSVALSPLWSTEWTVSKVRCLMQGAAIYGSFKCLKVLFEKVTADCEMEEAAGSLLHDAIRQVYVLRRPGSSPSERNRADQVLKLILDQGGSFLHLRDTNQQPPLLHTAARYGLEMVCGQILNAIQAGEVNGGVRWDAYLNYGSSLGAAARNGHVATVKFLVAAAAEVSSSCESLRDTDALAIAILSEHEEIAEHLIRHNFGTLYESRTGRNVLHLAVEKGLLATVQSLINAKFELNNYDSQHVTPVLLASSQGKQEIVEALVSAGADTTVADARGWLPKDHAAYRGHLKLAQTLPDGGSLVIQAERGKKTPAKTIIPARSELDSVIFVYLGTQDSRKRDPLRLPPWVLEGTGLMLRISLVGDMSQSFTEVLPILGNRSDVPWRFKTAAPKEAALSVEIRHQHDHQTIATGTTWLSNLNSDPATHRESLVREITLLLKGNNDKPAGVLIFSVVTAR
ncbi:hypothetical protein S40288_07063, partial [Stachybotrys chartarum IBT 40288]